jgi:SAM-dependent methyltransferase
MTHNHEEALKYWNDEAVESMYDKHLLRAEIALIKRHVDEGAHILDVGCGEGEGTLAYSHIPQVTITATDFSETRLAKAATTLRGRSNVRLEKVDFVANYDLKDSYDTIVSQRFLINLTDWRLQQKVLRALTGLLKPGGKLVLLEGSRNGVDALNRFRSVFGLPPIPVKWHNLFFDDDQLVAFMNGLDTKLAAHDGLGEYFLLTRGVRPIFEKNLIWDCEFNKIAATDEARQALNVGAHFSRVKLWVFTR